MITDRIGLHSVLLPSLKLSLAAVISITSIISIHLPAFYHKCRPLIGYATHFLICDSKQRSSARWGPLLYVFEVSVKRITDVRANCFCASLLRTTGLKNVCACARFHGSRWPQKPRHHTKPRNNGGVFKKFRMAPRLRWKGRATLKTVEKIFTQASSTIARHILFCTKGFKACTIGEDSA